MQLLKSRVCIAILTVGVYSSPSQATSCGMTKDGQPDCYTPPDWVYSLMTTSGPTILSEQTTHSDGPHAAKQRRRNFVLSNFAVLKQQTALGQGEHHSTLLSFYPSVDRLNQRQQHAIFSTDAQAAYQALERLTEQEIWLTDHNQPASPRRHRPR